MKNPIIILFAVLLFSLKINAQETGKITGSVVTFNETPLEKVNITAQNANFSVVTNSEGYFTINNVKITFSDASNLPHHCILKLQ